MNKREINDIIDLIISDQSEFDKIPETREESISLFVKCIVNWTFELKQAVETEEFELAAKIKKVMGKEVEIYVEVAQHLGYHETEDTVLYAVIIEQSLTAFNL